MTTLSSLIVARQAASISQVDEALARQVVRGGDLGTCVLELGHDRRRGAASVARRSARVRGRSSGRAAGRFARRLRLVPPAVALRYGIYPLEERDGELHVAVAEPLPQAVEDDLGFALGAHLRQFVAPLVRIRQAIARDYGLPLDRRFARLLAKLERRPDPSPSDIPPRNDQTPPFPGSGVRLSKTGTMIVQNAVPPPSAPLSEQTPSNLGPQRIIAPPARRNTWPGMASAPPDEASVQIPRPARTPSTPPEIVPSPAPPVVVPAPVAPQAVAAPPDRRPHPIRPPIRTPPARIPPPRRQPTFPPNLRLRRPNAA